MNPSHARILVTALASAAASSGAHAGVSADGRSVAVLVEEGPRVDGRLDDEAWARATPFSDFIQVRPVDGAEPTEVTSVRVVYDRENLYIGIRCADARADLVRGRARQDDVALTNDENVLITLDTNGDRRTGYSFNISSGGALTDGLIEDNEFIGDEWDGLVDLATSIDGEGWSVELAIPFKTIIVDPEADAWAINVSRRFAHRNELTRWRGGRAASTFDLSIGGDLEGIEGPLDQGRGLTLKPYITGNYDADTRDLDLEPGLDVFYRLTQRTTLSLTFNTDFAETEVDDRVVNLTRFPVFFPEQRDFFLEDAGVFEFGGINVSPNPFFSRRIGLAGGEERGILAGARVTGREGGWTFGAMSVQMDDTEELGSKNLSVFRLRRNVLDYSTVGAIVTHGDPDERGDNTLVGLDFNHRQPIMGGDGTFEANAWAQLTRSDPDTREASNSDASAVGGRVSVQTPDWSGRLFLARIGEDYDPALGFVQRRGVYEVAGGFTRSVYMSPEESWLQSIEIGQSIGAFLLVSGEPDTADYRFLDLELETQSGDFAGLELAYHHENLEEPFEIVDGVFVPVDRYDNMGVRVSAGTARRRAASLRGSAEYRTFFTGNRASYSVALDTNLTPWLDTEFFYSYDDVDLGPDSFVVQLARLRAAILFSPDMSLSSTVQWDSLSDQVGVNVRYAWEFRPGQDLFIVYNEGFDVDDGSFTSRDQAVSVKVGLTFRF